MIQMLVDGESDFVSLQEIPHKEIRKRWRRIKSHNPFLNLMSSLDVSDGKKQLDLPPVPEDDDLNPTVIEVMTDIEVLLDGSSVIDVFAVNSARRKRVEVSERKMTDTDRSLFKKAKELELQSWLDHRVFDLVKKNLLIKRELCVRGGS